MPVLHASWTPGTLTGGLVGMRPERLWRERSGPGLFNDDPYLKRLNLILRAELAARELYLNYCARFRSVPQSEAISDAHLRASKTLLNLIVSHRGLPEFEGFNLPSEIPLVTLQLARLMPRRLSTVTADRSCQRMERWLVAAYGRAISQACPKDFGILQDLLATARCNLRALKSQ